MKSKKYIDLHTHTFYSDGLLSPKKLIKKSSKYNLSAIAITDHDTIEGFTPEIFNYSKKLGVELITGIEFSTMDEEKKEYHILGLFIDIKNPTLKKILIKIKKDKINNIQKIINLMKKDGWFINKKNILKNKGTISKSHLAREIIKNEKNLKKIKSIFNKKIPTEGKFIETTMIKEKPYYVNNSKKINTKKAIEIIHESKGVAILAHPCSYLTRGEKLGHLCKKMKKIKIDGFEAINIQFDKNNNEKEFECIDLLTKYAYSNNLIITGGSDYHHSNKKIIGKFIDLGFRNHRLKVFREILDKAKRYNKLKQQNK